jgi:serine/threonine protein kinase
VQLVTCCKTRGVLPDKRDLTDWMVFAPVPPHFTPSRCRNARRVACAQAPELLMNKPCTVKVDIYSFGIILWELCTGEAPQRGKLRAIRCLACVWSWVWV